MNYKEIKELNDSIQSGISKYAQDALLAYKINESLKVPQGVSMKDYVMNQMYDFPSEDITEQKVQSGWGEDRLDKNMVFPGELYNLEENRAQRQKAISQFANGVFKGVITAGTTFADGVAGTVMGVLNLGYDAINGNIDSWTDAGNSFINNPFSAAMHDVQEWSEKIAPNHYTEYEKNAPWYKNIFTANFIGDKFLKNTGFMIGAAYSGKLAVGLGAKALHLKKARDAFKGMVYTSSGKALKSSKDIYKAYLTGDAFMDGVKLTEDLGKAAKKLRNSEWGLKLFGATNAAMGEGRIEAISNIEPIRETLTMKNDEDLAVATQAIQNELFEKHPEWFSIVQNDAGMKMQLTDPKGIEEYNKRFSLIRKQYEERQAEIEKLSAAASNQIFLFNLPLLTAGDLFQFGKFLMGGYSTNRIASSFIKGSIKEGFSVAPGTMKTALKMAARPLIEGQEEMTQAGISEGAGIHAIKKYDNFYEKQIDPDAEEDIVSLVNSLSEGLKDTYSDPQEWEQFFIGALTSVLGIPSFTRTNDGKIKVGVSGDFWDVRREAKQNIETANTIVDYLNKRIQDKDFLNYYRGIIRHNSYEKDMNTALEGSDPFQYKNAELSQFVSDAIMFENAGRIQDLYDTIEEAGEVSEGDIESIRTLTTDKISGKSPYDGMSDKQIVDKINKNISDYKELLDKYVEVSNNLKATYGIDMTAPILQEMTWSLMNIDDLEYRFRNLYDKVVQELGIKEKIIEEELTPADVILSLSDSESMKVLDELKKYRKTDPEATQLFKDIGDLKSILKSRADFINKYQKLSIDPSSFNEQIKKSEDKTVKKKTAKTNKQAKEILASARSPKEYRKVKSDLLSSGKYTQQNIGKIENELIEEKNEIPIKTRNIRNFADGVISRISNSPISRKTKADAVEIINKAAENADSYEEMLSPDSPYLTDENLFYNDTNPRSESAEQDTIRFIEAQAALSSAIQEQLKEEQINMQSSVFTVKENESSVKKKETVRTNPKDNTSGGVKAKPVSEHLAMSDSAIVEEDPFEAPIVEDNTQIEPEESKQHYLKNEKTPEVQNIQDVPDKTYTYWESALSKYLFSALNHHDPQYIELGDTEKVREFLNNPDFPDFSKVYNYLKSKGAFEYVDNGNVKIGDIIHLAIDPSFDSNQVLLVKRLEEGVQIIGVLNKDKRYENLDVIIDKVREDFKKADPNKFFISDYSTKVWRVTEGYPLMINAFTNLKNITNNAIFAVVHNGSWALGKYSGSSKDFDTAPYMSNKNGEVYVAVKTPKSSPKYYMRKVDIRYFRKDDLNIEELRNTESGQAILKSLENIFADMIKASTQKELNTAVKNLNDILYVGGLTVRLSKDEKSIIFSRTMLDDSGNPVKEGIGDGRLANKQIFIQRVDKASPTAIPVILDIIYDQGFKFQVKKELINNPEYNRKLIEAGIVMTDLFSMHTEGARVLLDPIKETKSSNQPVKISEQKHTQDNSKPVNNTNENIFGGQEEQYYDDNENTVKSAYMADGGTILGIPVKIFANPVYTSYGRKTPALAGYQYGIKFPNNHTVVVRGINPKISLKEAVGLFKQMFEGPVLKAYTQEKLDKAVSEFKKISALPVYTVTENKVDYNAVRDGIFHLREVDEQEESSLFDLNEEIEQVKKMLPNIPIHVIDKLIEIEEKKAWGMFNNAGITLSNIAAEGTAYHEAFHAVFSLGLNLVERVELISEAAKDSGLTDSVEIQEWLAERFREYTINQKTKTIGQKIRDFFKKLLTYVHIIKDTQPYRYYIFKKIIDREYKKTELSEDFLNGTMLRAEEYTPEIIGIVREGMKKGLVTINEAGKLILYAKPGVLSELNERQWVHVRTRTFKEWFGDWENDPENASKVINPTTGEPLVVYHKSTAKGFSEFNLDKSLKKEVSKSYTFHFGSEQAAKEINTFGYEGDIYQNFLSIKNPVDLEDSIQEYANNMINYFHSEKAAEKYGKRLSDDLFYKTREIITDFYESDERKREAVKEVLDYMGFDGIRYINNVEDPGSISYSVPTSNQIKDAWKNNGNYDIRETNTLLREVNVTNITANVNSENLKKLGYSEEFIKNATPEMIEAAIQCK